MDDEGCSAAREDRVGSRRKRHPRVSHHRLRRTVGRDREVLHVACVRPERILQAVLLAVRIEVRTGGLERRRLAFRRLMNMDGMLAGWQILEIEGNRHAAGGFC
jgi:hypothetical protein